MNASTQPAKDYRSVALAAWILIGLTCLLALIPAIGFLTWLIGGPIMLISLILGIVVISKGGTFQGIVILLMTFIVLPIFLVLAPLVMTGLMAAGMEASNPNRELKSGESELDVDVEEEGLQGLEQQGSSNR